MHPAHRRSRRWPDNWLQGATALGFGRRWIDAHVATARALGKPLVLEARQGQGQGLRRGWGKPAVWLRAAGP